MAQNLVVNGVTYNGVAGVSFVNESGESIMYYENGENEMTIPDYWLTALQEGVENINTAVEAAGRNKSAFLWYHDSHWGYNSAMSPKLLAYLQKYTALNKVNFGGDIANDYESPDTGKTDDGWMDLMREWRLAVRELRNHHSVVGNHDYDGTVAHLGVTNHLYGFLMASEETADIVRGDDFYYYIDEPSEETRYLYLSTGFFAVSDAETQFVVDALTSTPDGWHIVVISHIWFIYEDTSTPTVGSVPTYCQRLLALFDAYNAKGSGSVTMNSTAISYDFTNAGGKVEFCIGGHIHVDYDFTSDSGIPVILTEADSRHIRSGLAYTEGTISEASVNAIIADYDNGKISVIRIGRGDSREVVIDSATQTTYTNALKTAVDTDGGLFNGGLGYKEKTRLSNGSETSASYFDTTGFIMATRGDTIRLKNVTFCETTYQKSSVAFYDDSFAFLESSPAFTTPSAVGTAWNAVANESGTDVVQFTLPTSYPATTKYIRIVCSDLNADSIITVNEEID